MFSCGVAPWDGRVAFFLENAAAVRFLYAVFRYCHAADGGRRQSGSAQRVTGIRDGRIGMKPATDFAKQLLFWKNAYFSAVFQKNAYFFGFFK